MADTFDIQRVPQGLQNLLNLFGGMTPQRLSNEVFGTLDLLQFYGLQQRTVLFTNNAALAAPGNVDIALGTVIGPAAWCLLYAANTTIVKTATMTSSWLNVNIQRGASGSFQSYASGGQGPYGATVAGAADLCFVPPYPLLLPPQSTIRGRLQNLGTDATANVTITAEIGVFG